MLPLAHYSNIVLMCRACWLTRNVPRGATITIRTILQDQSVTCLVTPHAQCRGAQRAVRLDEMALVIELGRMFYGDGAMHCYFGKKEAQRYRQRLGKKVTRLEGVVVVLSHDNEVLTTYRNRKGIKHIRRKAA